VASLLAQHLALPPEEREDCIRCARAELSVDRLPAPARSVPRGAFMPASHTHVPVAQAAQSLAAPLPSGTVTFLFTDIEGSTQL
jgi:hypothetical protein